MKYFLAIVYLVVQFSSYFTLAVAFETQKKIDGIGSDKSDNEFEFIDSNLEENVFNERADLFGIDERAVVTWAVPCVASAGGGGNATLRTLSFSGCLANRNCSVGVSTNYNIAMTFRTASNESGITLDVTANALTPPNNPSPSVGYFTIPGNASSAVDYSFSQNIQFSSATFNQNRSGTYQLQFKVQSLRNRTVLVCRTFNVNLNASRPATPGGNNTGKEFGAACANLGLPCAFTDSLCRSSGGGSNTCQCNLQSFHEGGSKCRRYVGQDCDKSDQCIKNAECAKASGSSKKMCGCKKGYKNTSNDPYHCNGGNVIAFSVFILIALQLGIFLNKAL